MFHSLKCVNKEDWDFDKQSHGKDNGQWVQAALGEIPFGHMRNFGRAHCET